MNHFDEWLDSAPEQPISDDVVSFMFNIYEDDDDWCCDEMTDFGSREQPCSWKEKTNWESILEDVEKHIEDYLTKRDTRGHFKKPSGRRPRICRRRSDSHNGAVESTVK